MKTFAIIMGALALAASPADAQFGFQEVRSKWEAARQAAQDDPSSALARFEEVLAISPGNANLMFGALRAAMSAGDGERVARWGRALADLGAVPPEAELTRMVESVRASHGDQAAMLLARAFAANAEARVSSQAFAVLPIGLQLVEGIAFDPADRAFYVSTVADPGLYRLTEGGAPVRLALPTDWGSVLGLTVDAGRRTLWAAVAVVDPTPRAETPRRAGLARIDLESGQATLIAGPGADALNIGDVALAADGTVYAADSQSGIVYRCLPGCDLLSPFVPAGRFRSAQGMALSPDGSKLYVADYAYGIGVVDLGSGETRPLDTTSSVALDGVDGLVAFRGDLIAVRNGTRPVQIVRLKLEPSGGRVLAAQVLERAAPHFDEPTQGSVAGDQYYFIANSQWPIYGAGGLQPGRNAAPTQIRHLPLAAADR